MTEDGCAKVSSSSPNHEEDSSASASTRERKKRKWDQPAEVLISNGAAIPGVIPFGNFSALHGISPPAVAIANSTPLSTISSPHVYQTALLQSNPATMLLKLNQETSTKLALPVTKIQDELIAREIVINDAESTIRYKLTKRQTQEEIQKATGAVVITRGKYRPPNALPDNEKPLYLHISAGVHLKDTAERIKAVDCAASMVEETLRQGQCGSQTSEPFSTTLFLGFEVDPSSDVASRIWGPNDQYVNHIMNETGATVVLRGKGSGHPETSLDETQRLHLYLSSNNLKSLEAAKLLAENLLDTISLEFGATRLPSIKAYTAVPPPKQQLNGIEVAVANGDCSVRVGTAASGIINGEQMHAAALSFPQPSLTGGTSYNGYGGIYPQATPLQQVALALIRPPVSVKQSNVPSTSAVGARNSDSEKSQNQRRFQRRKFQEVPLSLKETAGNHENLQTEQEFLRSGSGNQLEGPSRLSEMPPPRKLVQPLVNGMAQITTRSMPPPPPKSMLPPPPQRSTLPQPPADSCMPPPPPKIVEASLKKEVVVPEKANVIATPSDILLKLAEYGDDDEDDGDIGES